jgi:hypothetical protein
MITRRLVDVAAAAVAIDGRRTVIRAWIRRGHLTLYDGMLDLDEVYQCELERRRVEQWIRSVDVVACTVTLRAVGRSAP